MTPRERSTLLRMARNIASGLAANPNRIGHQELASEAVTIALEIFKAPRLEVTEGDER